ncbi:MAG: hypothetical protein K6F63_10110 [Lachnospiraceae bacterium]|nr:hypothetical protein [Lachnospiraceae bacterium]
MEKNYLDAKNFWNQVFVLKYFVAEDIIYFAWPGEQEERRRIFIMKKAKEQTTIIGRRS